MTLAPKASGGQRDITPQTTVSSSDNVTSLWGGRTADDVSQDVWSQASGGGLPDLPGQYGAAPTLEELPF
jgi:hypothetical protein